MACAGEGIPRVRQFDGSVRRSRKSACSHRAGARQTSRIGFRLFNPLETNALGDPHCIAATRSPNRSRRGSESRCRSIRPLHPATQTSNRCATNVRLNTVYRSCLWALVDMVFSAGPDGGSQNLLLRASIGSNEARCLSMIAKRQSCRGEHRPKRGLSSFTSGACTMGNALQGH